MNLTFNHFAKLQPTLGGLAYWSAVCLMIDSERDDIGVFN
jgi:hypothetical protein